MSESWAQKIRRAELRTRPARIPINLSLTIGLNRRFFEESATLKLHPNQLASQIVEAWLVGRKREVNR